MLKDVFVASVPDFDPGDTVNYTLRYIFYSGDCKNPQFSVLTGLWSYHEDVYSRLVADSSVTHCLVEYVCEYSSDFCGLALPIKSPSVDDSGVL